jgi:hypothetical protein
MIGLCLACSFMHDKSFGIKARAVCGGTGELLMVEAGELVDPAESCSSAFRSSICLYEPYILLLLATWTGRRIHKYGQKVHYALECCPRKWIARRGRAVSLTTPRWPSLH